MNELIYKISVFPLDLVLLPGEEMPLRIFEPRYKQLISECIDNAQPFGIPYMRKDTMTEFGSEVEIVKVVGKNSHNDMVIVIKGKSLFKTIDYFPELPNKLYGGSLVRHYNENFTTTNPEIAVKVKTLKINLSSEFGTLIIGDSINMLDIAKALMISSDEKHKLISIADKNSREQLLIKHLMFVEMIRNQEKKLENNFQLN